MTSCCRVVTVVSPYVRASVRARLRGRSSRAVALASGDNGDNGLACGLCGHVFASGSVVTVRDVWKKRRRVLACGLCTDRFRLAVLVVPGAARPGTSPGAMGGRSRFPEMNDRKRRSLRSCIATEGGGG